MKENESIQYSLGYQDGFLDAKKQFERPQAEWIKAELTEDYKQYGFDLRIICSSCGSEHSYFEFNKYQEPVAVTFIRSRFCPYCGAQMKGVSDNG